MMNSSGDGKRINNNRAPVMHEVALFREQWPFDCAVMLALAFHSRNRLKGGNNPLQNDVLVKAGQIPELRREQQLLDGHSDFFNIFNLSG